MDWCCLTDEYLTVHPLLQCARCRKFIAVVPIFDDLAMDLFLLTAVALEPLTKPGTLRPLAQP